MHVRQTLQQAGATGAMSAARDVSGEKRTERWRSMVSVWCPLVALRRPRRGGPTRRDYFVRFADQLTAPVSHCVNGVPSE